MELALSLGDTPKPFSLLDHHSGSQQQKMKDLGFCMGLGSTRNLEDLHIKNMMREKDDEKVISCSSSSDPSSSPPPLPLQLDLLPFSPVLKSPPPPPPPSLSHRPFPWLSKNLIVESGSQSKLVKVIDAKPLTTVSDGEELAAGEYSSPNNSNSGTSSFQMDFSSIFNGGRSFNSRKRDLELSVNLELVDATERDHRACSRGGGGMSDEDENGLTRKKLRLTKEQSAFLEDSFKEHNTLNPKQKQALAKQLNLRPRQVEVWFQNRRARTKLKQTEVDCEYLKRCCETLTEENRRLQKELQELRALKTNQPYYMQMPATTLTMCPSCERVATTTTSTTTTSPCQQAPPTGSHGL
ncbi:putative transcription factor homeobox-WOX family [Helianthus annuus]|uniref:Putative leucine zipper, homeobox-associated, Homeodomain-like protein n=1 Tax=Helianthus annuus TaxID=4232 RepID=A0A251SN21_HELAN|nr:homeobox-leucine zipper protein HOX11 [Helianthus annuus]KAF5771943.1 putative transcription factor HB-HD-ZIP family [Helianthus annuus]KAJ0475652.1 putative transcription factor homeobox-WOX family [Helianthus annuus]KAJ0496435.1 putative transcription factor homeobox-WOX family [Helianthus annuus]KAJ0856761.1 putative transcription factor homeobox-WOX family [Helianthus annuus]